MKRPRWVRITEREHYALATAVALLEASDDDADAEYRRDVAACINVLDRWHKGPTTLPKRDDDEDVEYFSLPLRCLGCGEVGEMNPAVGHDPDVYECGACEARMRRGTW